MSGPVTILGGGVMGLCAATELSARGVSVTIVDPAGEQRMAASRPELFSQVI